MPMYSAYISAMIWTMRLRGYNAISTPAMANATAVCDDGHPQNMPFSKKPKLNPWLTSFIPEMNTCGGWIRPVNALSAVDTRYPAIDACPSAQAVMICDLFFLIIPQDRYMSIPKIGTIAPTMTAGNVMV